MQRSNIKKSVVALAIAQGLSINAGAATISLNASCSLRDAIQSANSDSPVNGCLAGNGDDTIVMMASSTITLIGVDPDGAMVAGLPPISSNISIQGNDSTITRDDNALGFRIFTVENDATFELDNTTVTNGVGTGAAIQAVDAELVKITNSTISNHTSGTVNGSANNSNIGINLINTDLELTDSVVTQNSGTNNVGIFIESGNAIVTQSQITYNSATTSNAGFYISYGSVNMSNAVVSNNSADFSSGFTCYSPSTVAVTDSQINSNSGTDSGFYVYQGDSFGALNLTISNTEVNLNQGDHSGFYIYSESSTQASSATIDNLTVSQNSSDSSAGIDLIGSMLTVTGTNIDVTQNQGGDDDFSGMSISDGAVVNINDLELSNNSPKTGAISNRSGITVDGATLTLIDSTISNNSAQRLSSALYLTNDSSAELSTTEISNNVLVNGTSGIHSPIHVDNSTLKLSNVTLDSNTSARDGGAIHADNGSSLTINGSTFSNNFSPSSYGGGALYLGNGVDATIANSTFSGNQSGDGAAIKSVASNSLIMNNVTVANQSAAAQDGSAFTFSVSGISSQFAINNSLFSGNSGDICNTILPGGGGTSNWFEDASCTGFAQGQLLIESLADNGGNTLTHALPLGSPAIDTGDSSVCSTSPINNLDQRGEDRGSLCDIGAYEYIDDTNFFIIRAKNGNTAVVPL